MLPDWASGYNRATLVADLVAAVIVTIMLIPQSLAYGMLAGLPAETGLYATILPLAAYALFGSSRTLSVGPVAVISLMTASAVAGLGGRADPLVAAVALALLSGLMLLAMGVLRLGFLSNLLSHPVVSGFITASAILIAVGQLKHLLGVSVDGDTLPGMLVSLAHHADTLHVPTLLVGTGVILFLAAARAWLAPALEWLGLATGLAATVARASPVLAVLVTGGCAWGFALDEAGVALVGAIPSGLPTLAMPPPDFALWRELLGSALLISIIGYVESISVGRSLATRRHQRVNPDRELIGLGAANVASAFSGGFPVTGGFSRSVVNFDAGAVTPAASMFTAAGVALAAVALTPLLAYLPRATLAAVIIVAVASLVNFSILRLAWQFSRSDFLAVIITMVTTLWLGVELGVMSGVACSVLLHLHRTSRPHMAVVGEVPGTEHFRNVKRHAVVTCDEIVSLRIDESLYFANAAYVEECVFVLVAENRSVKHFVLMCPAVNEIDLSALETLEGINARLAELGVQLHLSEVKGPVMDSLERTEFLDHLTGSVFLSQHQAIEALSGRSE